MIRKSTPTKDSDLESYTEELHENLIEEELLGVEGTENQGLPLFDPAHSAKVLDIISQIVPQALEPSRKTELVDKIGKVGNQITSLKISKQVKETIPIRSIQLAKLTFQRAPHSRQFNHLVMSQEALNSTDTSVDLETEQAMDTAAGMNDSDRLSADSGGDQPEVSNNKEIPASNFQLKQLMSPGTGTGARDNTSPRVVQCQTNGKREVSIPNATLYSSSEESDDAIVVTKKGGKSKSKKLRSDPVTEPASQPRTTCDCGKPFPRSDDSYQITQLQEEVRTMKESLESIMAFLTNQQQLLTEIKNVTHDVKESVITYSASARAMDHRVHELEQAAKTAAQPAGSPQASTSGGPQVNQKIPESQEIICQNVPSFVFTEDNIGYLIKKYKKHAQQRGDMKILNEGKIREICTEGGILAWLHARHPDTVLPESDVTDLKGGQVKWSAFIKLDTALAGVELAASIKGVDAGGTGVAYRPVTSTSHHPKPSTYSRGQTKKGGMFSSLID